MANCRFEVNVPNPTRRALAVELSLEEGSLDELGALGFPVRDGQLEIIDAGISLDACAERGEAQTKVKLGPAESVNVYVVITTAGGAGAAVLHLVDRRAGRPDGGVMLVCTDGLDGDRNGVVVSPNAPCPIVLGRDPYPADDDLATAPNSIVLPLGSWQNLVFELLNPTNDVVASANAYLEHLGLAIGDFEPGTWQIGDLGPGETFYAVWRVRVDAATGTFAPSVVVGSDKTDPVRLTGAVVVPEDREGREGPTERDPKARPAA